MQNLVTYSSQLVNNSPAVVLHVEGENKRRVYLFDDATSVETALEMLKTFDTQLDDALAVSFIGDGDNGILLSTDTEHFLFTFSDFDINTAGRLMQTYNSLIADNDED